MGRKQGTSDEEIKQAIVEILAAGVPAYPANVRQHLMQKLGRAGATSRIAILIKESISATQKGDAHVLDGILVPPSLTALASDFVTKLFSHAKLEARSEMDAELTEAQSLLESKTRLVKRVVDREIKAREAAESKSGLLQAQLREQQQMVAGLQNELARMAADRDAAKLLLEQQRDAHNRDAEKWEKRNLELERDLRRASAKPTNALSGKDVDALAQAILAKTSHNQVHRKAKKD